jgi:hypothetical protein|tara:strand:- start:616 stop:786 length:171 start_codon:yes stop_codon:yes gene_type:complete
MLIDESLDIFEAGGKVGLTTSTGTVVLKDNFEVSDIRRIQAFLKAMLELRSRLPSE